MKKAYTVGLSLLTLSLIQSPAAAQGVPELMYYRFDSAAAVQANYASAPVGTNPTAVMGMTVGGGGQFGTALTGNGGASDLNAVDNGWATNLGAGTWTISMWLSNFPATAATSYYFFGDAGSGFRCFTGGVAGNNNIMLRGTGVTDVVVSSVGSSPVVLHFVHEVTPSDVIKVYKNGVLVSTVAQTGPLNISGNGFKIGGYSSVNSLPPGCLMDEFRMYNRALPATEIANTWNALLGTIPLSATVIDFAASSSKHKVRLSWDVSSDEEVDHFVPERSFNGEEFTAMTTVMKNTQGDRYEVVDNEVAGYANNGYVYYRLVVKGTDGRSEYSRVVKIWVREAEEILSVYPNPFVGEIFITTDVPEKGSASVSLTDFMGRTVCSEVQEVHKGSNRLSLTGLAALAKGMYQVNVRINGKICTGEVVK